MSDQNQDLRQEEIQNALPTQSADEPAHHNGQQQESYFDVKTLSVEKKFAKDFTKNLGLSILATSRVGRMTSNIFNVFQAMEKVFKQGQADRKQVAELTRHLQENPDVLVGTRKLAEQRNASPVKKVNKAKAIARSLDDNVNQRNRQRSKQQSRRQNKDRTR